MPSRDRLADWLAGLSCLTEKWLADVKLGNGKEWSAVIRAGQTLCVHVCAPVRICLLPKRRFTPSDSRHWQIDAFLDMCIQVCTHCLSESCPRWPTNISSLHFQLGAAMSHGWCYWQLPSWHQVLELAGMNVQQVLHFQYFDVLQSTCLLLPWYYSFQR